MRIIFRELDCSIPTIRRFSEFKFIDTALSKEDLTDQRRENMVQEKYKSENNQKMVLSSPSRSPQSPVPTGPKS